MKVWNGTSAVIHVVTNGEPSALESVGVGSLAKRKKGKELAVVKVGVLNALEEGLVAHVV